MAAMRAEMVQRAKSGQASSQNRAAADSRTQRWEAIERFSGSSNFSSPPLTISEKQWRISWKANPDVQINGVPFTGSFALEVQAADGEQVREVTSTLGPSDGMVSLEGPGTYLCNVRSTGSWTVSVETPNL